MDWVLRKKKEKWRFGENRGKTGGWNLKTWAEQTLPRDEWGETSDSAQLGEWGGVLANDQITHKEWKSHKKIS